MDPLHLIETLSVNGVEFYAGVPDSLLADFCGCVEENPELCKHVSAANEGCAVALAAGHYLATGKTPCVYMQNSGLGNAVNPLVSLMDQEIYGIPALLLIGWRAELREGAQLADEPQHKKQGRITPELLDTLTMRYEILGPSGVEGGCDQGLLSLLKETRRTNQPVALLVRQGTFTSARNPRLDTQAGLTREDAIATVIRNLGARTCVVGTTGKISRELYEIRQGISGKHDLDFLTVGSMGHASQIAAGIAMADGARPVVCLDGDGACFMHMGGLVTAARIKNIRHVVFNNRVHDSVGGQPTCGPDISLAQIAQACGYAFVDTASKMSDLPEKIGRMMSIDGSAFLEINVRPGARKELGRPKRSPKEAKVKFMATIASDLIT